MSDEPAAPHRIPTATLAGAHAAVGTPSAPIGLVQERWHSDPGEHEAALATGIGIAAGEGARIVCLQELTLSRYFATTPDGPAAAGAEPEDLETGPTATFARRMADDSAPTSTPRCTSARTGRTGRRARIQHGRRRRPDGTLASSTRKLHIPITAGYYEDRYFRPGPPGDESLPARALPVRRRTGATRLPHLLGPVVSRARPRLLAAGAEVLIYPTAIGSEPDHPDFDTAAPVAAGDRRQRGRQRHLHGRRQPDRDRAPLTFYGSSFISDPYGRVLVQAPRDEPAVLVADLDLDQRRDWLELFPFLTTRRPGAYGALTRE